MEYTTNLNLKKPDINEYYNIVEQENENADIIDEAIGKLNSDVGTEELTTEAQDCKGAINELNKKLELGTKNPITFSSQFKSYDANGINVYHKSGNMVTIRGVTTPIATITKNTETLIFTLPNGYRPPYNITVVMQGSGVNKWNLNINADGRVTSTRYGTNEIIDIPAGAWMPFYCCFEVE